MWTRPAKDQVARAVVENRQVGNEVQQRLARVGADAARVVGFAGVKMWQGAFAAGDEARQEELASGGPAAVEPPQLDKPYSNTLGMEFLPIGSSGMLYSIYETRVRDFEAFARKTGRGN